MEAELEAELQRLQAEVTDLQTQLQEQQREMSFDFRGNLLLALAVLCGQAAVPSERQTVASRLQEELEELQEDVERQTQVNGVRVVSCKRREDRKAAAGRAGGSSSSQWLCVSGVCSELHFLVEFKVSELQVGAQTTRALGQLSIVMEDTELRSLDRFISRVEESQDLLLFFRTLRTFSDRCDERQRTFSHFQVQYPSVVSLPGGQRSEVMTLHHPKLPGCLVLVHWSVQVNEDGAVKLNVELLPKIPHNALRLFRASPVGGAAEAFHSLQRILGVEGALEAVVTAMSESHDQGQ